MKHTFLALIPFITGCPVAMESQPEPVYLTQEFYDWSCSDYEDYSEINVITETCDDDVRFIVAELHLSDGDVWKTNLKREDIADCIWEERFVLIEEYCIQVEGVTLIAWVD